jgi:large subunit ribosomal protein L10
MPTAHKAATIGELTTLLQNSQVAVVTDYRGLSVAAISQLRRSLRGKAELHITKNTLLTRAAAAANVPQLTELLTGPTAVAFIQDDIAGSIKALNDFVRTSRILTLRGALFGPSLVPADKVGDLANVPTRQQLYAQIVGALQGPLNNLVGTLNQSYSQVVFALQAYADQQGDTTATAADDTTVASTADTTVATGDTAGDAVTTSYSAAAGDGSATVSDAGIVAATSDTATAADDAGASAVSSDTVTGADAAGSADTQSSETVTPEPEV